jgi:type IV secretion system protein TrbE
MASQIERFARRLSRIMSPHTASRVRRSGMPNGFLNTGLVWYGDGASDRTAVAKGFVIEPGEIATFDEGSMSHLYDRIRCLIAILPDGYSIQVKYLVCSDYSDVLPRYQAETSAIGDKYLYRWQIWNRTERAQRYADAMAQGKLRREIFIIFFTRVIDTEPKFTLSDKALQKHYQELAARESAGFANVQYDALQTLFPDCRITMMGDREHYLYYYRFLNPSSSASIPEHAEETYTPALTIQENCLFGDLVQPGYRGVSFQLDTLNHAILVMRQLPKRSGPGLISKVLDLGFGDYELTVNVYPQNPDKVVRQIEQAANQLEGDVHTNRKHKYSLSEQHKMAQERITELERGNVFPADVLFVVRLWDKDPEVVVSRASIVVNAFGSMSGATCHWVTNAETARQLFYQTWPGWTFGDYRGYDLPTDDATAAELLPWSATFTGRLREAEALYDSPKGGLVGLTTQVGGVPQNMLVFGVVRTGKSALMQDFWAQAGHNFQCLLVVEEGLSYGTTIETAGANPIVVVPDGKLTINYLDPHGPLTSEHLGAAVALCVEMLRESQSDPARVSVLQSRLSAHILHLYESVWQEWVRLNPDRAIEIGSRAYCIEQHRVNMREGSTFLDALVELRGQETGPVDEYEVAKFCTHPEGKDLVRNLGFAYMTRAEMPTHSELVELMTLIPLGDEAEKAEVRQIGERLKLWSSRAGSYGRLFDGISTIGLENNVTHFDLTGIPDAMSELKACVYFLVLNIARQQIMKRPRAERKLILLEEGARLIQLPGGAKAIKEFYGQMGKYGAVVATVFQQSAPLQCAPDDLRAAVIDNTKLFLISAQPSPSAADAIADMLELSSSARESIKRYPMPEHQVGQKFSSFLMVANDPRRKLVGTFRNLASPEMIYCSASDNKTWDQRQKALNAYDDVVTGILTEARKNR